MLTSDLNGTGSVRVLDAAKRFGQSRGRAPRVLLCSTAEMFGHPAQSAERVDPIEPVSPYGVVKAFAHRMAQVSRSHGQHVSTVILYNHESPRRPDTFVTRKITKAAAGSHADQPNHCNWATCRLVAIGDFLSDYVKAMVAALRHEQPEDFVIATGVSHSIEDFVVAAFAAARIDNWQSHVAVDEVCCANDPADFVGDASKRAQSWAGLRRSTSRARHDDGEP